MSGSINYSKGILGTLEFPEGNVDGDTALAFGFKVIENPCVLKRSFSEFSSFFLEFFDFTFVNTTALVDQMTCGCGLSGIDVPNNNK
jgi:hypothetical protein